MSTPGVPIVPGPGGRWTSPNPAWAHLMQRESAGDPTVVQHGYTDVNTGGNEAEGLFQITPKTWREHGGTDFAPSPRLATPHQQALVAARIFMARPDGSDWGAGVPGREDPNELAAGLGLATHKKQYGGPVGYQGGGEAGDPLFTEEGPEYYARAYQHNAPFATEGPYQTKLSASQEQQFRQWVKSNRVPFDPDAGVVDYDMRGYWRDTGGAWSGGSTHFPDTYKTPYDTTFSAESKYARPGTPFVWRGDDLIDTRDGSLVFGQPKAPSKPGETQETPSIAPLDRPARQYFIRHPDGTETPVPLVRTGPNDWSAPGDVTVNPGDQFMSRPY